MKFWCSPTFKNITVVKFRMSKKKIIILPDPILRKVSKPVSQVDKEIKSLMDDMLKLCMQPLELV